MAKDNREARQKPKEHKKLDPMTPFSYLNLGSEDDPCFGKLYSIKSKICSKCGDCEACAVVTSQKGFIKSITAQNSKSEFLDIQEGELVDSQNEQINTYLQKKVKSKKTKEFSIKKAAIYFAEKFNLPESDITYVSQRIIKEAQSIKYVQLTKDLKKYMYGK